MDGLTTITPAMEFFEHGKECLQTLALQLSGYPSLKPVSGLNRIPLLRLEVEVYGKVGCSCHQNNSSNVAPLIESLSDFGSVSHEVT